MKTAVVILNWNGRKFLERFLPGLVASVEGRSEAAGAERGSEAGETGLRSEVIVADNASEDDSLRWMAENFPQIRTIVLDRNYGFTGGYNRALRQIEAEYYLLINSDIEVEPGLLEPLEEWMDSHPKCGVCAPKLLSYSDRSRFEYAGAAGGLIDRYGYPFCRGRVLRRTEKDEGQYNEPTDVFWVSGACMMVRAELFTRLGGFDERFFAHQEEIDLCWRIQLEGYRVTVVPGSKVYHVGGGTLPNDSPWKLELNFRNNLLMLNNNLARTYALQYYKAQMGYPPEPICAIPAADDAASRGDMPALERGHVHIKARADEADIIRRAVGHGCRKAKRTIFTRMVLDGCSAAAYLLTLQPKCFAAVVKGHREYRQLRYRNDLKSNTYYPYEAFQNGKSVKKTFRLSYKEDLRSGIRECIEETGGKADLEGMFPKWIVWQTFWRGKNIFRYLRAELEG